MYSEKQTATTNDLPLLQAAVWKHSHYSEMVFGNSILKVQMSCSS